MRRLQGFLKFLRKYFFFLLLLVLAGAVGFFLRPLKKTVSLFPMELHEGETQLSCETVLGTSIFPQPNWEQKTLQMVEAKVHGESDKVAIEIGGSTVRLMTPTTVEIGKMEPLELQILQNTSESIISMAYEETTLSNGITHSFILNKKTGFALWSKSNSAFILGGAPYNVVSYFRCY